MTKLNSSVAFKRDVTKKLLEILDYSVDRECSDIHLSSEREIRIRVFGRLEVIGGDQFFLSDADFDVIVRSLLSEVEYQLYQTGQEIDFSFKYKDRGVFRVNLFKQYKGSSMALRMLNAEIPQFDSLHLPEILKTACTYPSGIVLVTGPTGSGKSTTLASLIQRINDTEKEHILTLEDPIEYRFKESKSYINQRELNSHFISFSKALKAALREDPDIILVGEMRDMETIELALTAAETGHLVFSTLHTNSAAKTIDRIISAFPADKQQQVRSQLSETLKMVVAQKLCKTTDGKRRAALEILINSPAVGNLIREDKLHQIPSVIQTNKKLGMLSLYQSLYDLFAQGLITEEEALSHSMNKEQMKSLLRTPKVA